MGTRYIGVGVRRKEDPRLLTGRGTYVGDLLLPGMLQAAILRSPHAHARIAKIDLAPARAVPGVVAAIAYPDIADVARPLPQIVPHPALKKITPLPLAREKVRYVGEPVAVVVATDRAVAEDALEKIRVDYEPLPVAIDLERTLDAGAPHLHEEEGENLAAHVAFSVGDADRVFREAAHVIRETFRIARCSVQPLETRGVVAKYEVSRGEGFLTAWITTQSPHIARGILANLLDLPEARVRVIAPDVGGGFGGKNRFYPEYLLVALLAIRLGRPVKWIGDRREDFVSTYHERDQVHAIEMAVTAEGRILGLRDRFLNDNGAYDSSFGIIPPLTTAMTIPGPYRIPNYHVDVSCVFTNKTPLAPYRGAGRQQGIFVMERMMDLAARTLKLDPAELRFRNLIQPQEFPYNVGIPRRDGRGPVIYDRGDYPASLREALAAVDYAGFRERQVRLRAEGRYVGVGLACYVEMAGLGVFEGAAVRVDGSGRVWVGTGSASQGQSHETTLAQICAERLGVDLEDVSVTVGDTAAISLGVGTFASRSAVAAGSAVSLAATKVKEKALRVAALALGADPRDLRIEGGRVSVVGSTDRVITLGQIAQVLSGPKLSASGLPSVFQLPGDIEPGLEATHYFSSPELTYAYGTHLAMVEVDPETGEIRVLRYVVVHDCGTEINPKVVEGQIVGGVAQGIGNALFEEVVFDPSGQPLNTTYLDYLIPTAMEVPPVEVISMETPASFGPEGIKGTGEGGTIPAPAAILNAIDDALAPFGVRTTEMPMTPPKLLELLRRSRGSAKAQ